MISIIENAPAAHNASGKSWSINGQTAGFILTGAAFLLFAANDNFFGGGKEPDEDDELQEIFKKIFNPDWWVNP